MNGMKYHEYELQMKPGSCLFVYTDGVHDASNEANELFGMDRMLEALNSDDDSTPETVLKRVRQAVDDFTQDSEQFDDLTMLCVQYKGAQNEE